MGIGTLLGTSIVRIIVFKGSVFPINPKPLSSNNLKPGPPIWGDLPYKP